METSRIITLGSCCRVMWTLQNMDLRQQSCLFDWMKSDYFSDVLRILQLLADNQTITYRKDYDIGQDDFLHDTRIRTLHYNGRIEEVFTRRSQRFLDDVRSEQNILFLREDPDGIHTTNSELENFEKIILQINPKCNFKMILMTSSHYFQTHEPITHFSWLQHHARPDNDDQKYKKILMEYM